MITFIAIVLACVFIVVTDLGVSADWKYDRVFAASTTTFGSVGILVCFYVVMLQTNGGS